jgi:hypothetical protein
VSSPSLLSSPQPLHPLRLCRHAEEVRDADRAVSRLRLPLHDYRVAGPSLPLSSTPPPPQINWCASRAVLSTPPEITSRALTISRHEVALPSARLLSPPPSHSSNRSSLSQISALASPPHCSVLTFLLLCRLTPSLQRWRACISPTIPRLPSLSCAPGARKSSARQSSQDGDSARVTRSSPSLRRPQDSRTSGCRA